MAIRTEALFRDPSLCTLPGLGRKRERGSGDVVSTPANKRPYIEGVPCHNGPGSPQRPTRGCDPILESPELSSKVSGGVLAAASMPLFVTQGCQRPCSDSLHELSRMPHSQSCKDDCGEVQSFRTDVRRPTPKEALRSELGAAADTIIRVRWAGGASVSQSTCFKFVADVLVKVRECFSAQSKAEFWDWNTERRRADGDSPGPHPSHDQMPTLADMKWLYNEKVKPLTEGYPRELFFCSTCQGQTRLYELEGVIQHFAAKHTQTLSMGNTVLHWQREWPEKPLFNPNPDLSQIPAQRGWNAFLTQKTSRNLVTKEFSLQHQPALLLPFPQDQAMISRSTIPHLLPASSPGTRH